MSLWLKPGNQTCRPERRARERKLAAAYCRTLDSFLPPAKWNRSTTDSAHSIPAASTELEATARHATRERKLTSPYMAKLEINPVHRLL